MSVPSTLPTLRRIVTTHDSEGRSIIQSDEEIISKEGLNSSSRIARVWVTTDNLPTNDTNSTEDGGTRAIDDASNFYLVHPTGTNLQTCELAPGATVPMHRTSSLDHNILLSGEVIHITEDGQEKHLKNAGDVVIQRGTIHAWKNPSTDAWARWITVLMAAEPAIVDGKLLAPELKD